ncbi:hypothetical protein H6A09_01450 [[Clostridium] spiroforme]|nr:hypothetical protein [Thomasclavelia spiroformis]
MNDEMTICQCCEFLETMIGDQENIKECIDYIQERAEAMSRKLGEYKEMEMKYDHALEILEEKTVVPKRFWRKWL